MPADDDMKRCGCTGIRSCLLCRDSKDEIPDEKENKQTRTFWYCPGCQQTYPGNLTWWIADSSSSVSCRNHEDLEAQNIVQGIKVCEDFITENEAERLLESINKEEWKPSQSGRRKQDFGPKANFKRRKLKLGAFTGLPEYSQFLIDRFKKNILCLEQFIPVELCNLEYVSERGSSIDPHLDDMWLWGSHLVTLNVEGRTIITLSSTPVMNANRTGNKKKFDDNNLDKNGTSITCRTRNLHLNGSCEPDGFVSPDNHKPDNLVEVCSSEIEIQIPAPSKSLYILSNEARTIWLHGIKANHIHGKRTAMTFRNLSEEFENEAQYHDIKREVIELALSFKGTIVK